MKYCYDDIIRARNIMSNIESSTENLKTIYRMIKLTEEELDIVSEGIDTLMNLVEYANQLEDDKLNKLFKMKKIIRGE